MQAPQNFRAMMLDQERRLLSDSTNAVQFLQGDKDGSRQGNLFLTSAPGTTSYNGYNSSANNTGTSSLTSLAVYGANPVNSRFMVAGP